MRRSVPLVGALAFIASLTAVPARAAQEESEFNAEESRREALEKETGRLPGGKLRMKGSYRLAVGVTSEDFILNDSNADLQERNYRYISGERLNNTYDPAIYSQFALNTDFDATEKITLHSRIVADPWSWVGTTGEQVQRSDTGGQSVRYNLKFFGANNSTIPEIYRTNTGDSLSFPVIKVRDGHTTRTVVRGFSEFGSIPFTIPELDIDYEFRPFRELWMDYAEDNWHARVFAFADESQALTSDDPIGLSNHKDYWQQSPWLYQYVPIQYFSDRSIKRGYYSDELSFLARDSAGNRLVLLRGASVEADLGNTYFAATVATPYTPWDEKYLSVNAVPGAVRMKHQAADDVMVGGTYVFRTGLVNDSVVDHGQAFGADVKWALNPRTTLKGEWAISHRERDQMTDRSLSIPSSVEGYAYKGVVEHGFDHRWEGRADFNLSYTQFDHRFEPVLSRFSNTRDDEFWGKHLTFGEHPPGLEAFRLGDGVDTNRYVFRGTWREKLFKERFFNLFDNRYVRRENTGEFVENVMRDEVTVKITSRLTAKAMFRWHKLPKTTAGIEPFLADYYFIGSDDPSSLTFRNAAVPADNDADRYTYAAGLQYVFSPRWTAEGFVERTNDVPDFPRGLLNSMSRAANDRVDALLIDRLTNSLYSQGPLGGVPPYEYFTITRERLIWRPDARATVTFHAAQNDYKFAAGIDDNVTHQGVGVGLKMTERLSLFGDYTHSFQIDVPKLIATNLAESDYRGHHNLYASMDYRLKWNAIFRAEYGVFGLGQDSPRVTPYSTAPFSLPTIDTEHLLRVSLSGDF